MTYDPRPRNLSDVELPPRLEAFGEQLAEHVHDVWARQRLDDGWRYGPRRDDARKLHPLLVPYAQLPDSEKQYDRATARETLKLLVALGFTLVPPE